MTCPGDIGEDSFCNHAVEQTVKELGKVYILFILPDGIRVNAMAPGPAHSVHLD
ncbi:hypothetical protein ABEV00_26460 [Paenibacillus thiaminolyticus]|uniref:hypothetical protein n=1 Tax=Paenibacillus thiaminolyticus TaxID=49283 RepID=UPI003D26EF85